jgi:hypothetical protein
MQSNNLSRGVATPAGAEEASRINGQRRPTCLPAPLENIAENAALPNRSAGPVARESEGSGRAGKRVPVAITAFADPRHKAMARTLAYALTLADAAAWEAFALVTAARLTRAERAALAFWTLAALSRDDAAAVADAACGEGGAC